MVFPFLSVIVISASGRGDRKMICRQLSTSCTFISKVRGERVDALDSLSRALQCDLCLCASSVAAFIGIINNTDNRINNDFAFIFNSFIDLWRQRYGVLV